MSGTPAIDTRNQNSFIKQKQSKKKQKAKQTKKQKHVVVRICVLFHFCLLYFRILFALFSHVFVFFLGGYSFFSLLFLLYPPRKKTKQKRETCENQANKNAKIKRQK